MKLSRKWTIFLILMAAFGLIFYFIWRAEPKYAGIVIYFFYTIPANSFLSLPHEPAVLYYAKIYSPALLAVLGGIATCLACFIDYEVLTPIFRLQRVSKIKETYFYKKCIHYFNKLPFVTIAVVGLTPIPFYPVRILAISSEYSIRKYMLSVFIGRVPRYYILAKFGQILRIPNWIIILLFVVMIGLILLGRYPRTKSKNKV